MNLSARDKLLVITAGLLVALIALGAILIWPQFQKMARLDLDISAAQQEVQQAKMLLEQRQSMKNDAAATSSELLTLGTVMPQQPELPSLIIELQDAAYASGVTMVSVAPQAPTPSADAQYNVIPLDLSVQGTWADTVDFLQRLQRLTRGIRVVQTSTAIGAVDDSGKQPLYSVVSNVSVEAYAMIDAASQGTTPTATP